MEKKKLIILGVSVIFLWCITVIFFPAIEIDGHQYSKRKILHLKLQHKNNHDISHALLLQKVNDNIETRFSAYLDGINKMSFADYADDLLKETIKESFAEIDTAENSFINEFENMLQYKAKRFTLPLQTRDKSDKDTIINDVFPKMTNYSIDNRVYYGFAIDVVMEKLRIFKNKFPQMARSVIENNVNDKYEQYIKNLASQIGINADVNDSMRQTMLALREHGETLRFFEHLIQECDITEIFEIINCTIEPLDISEDLKPILLPVCIVDETVYDAFSLNSAVKKSRQLRNSWKQIREDSFGKILYKQRNVIINNLSLYNDIDDGIDIDELSVLISYYGEQIHVSAGLFSTELEQCIYATEEPDKYPIEIFSDVIDISPLSIDIVNIDNILYDADAVSRLFDVISDVRMNWNKFLSRENEKINNNVQKNFKNYYETNYGKYLMNSGMKEMSSAINYIMEAVDISGDLFLYFYDNCSVGSEDFAGTVIESSITKIDIEPFVLNVIDIDGGSYYAAGVNALRQSMKDLTGTIKADIQKNLRSIINIKTDESIANIDPYLAWYLDDGLPNNLLALLWRKLKQKAFGYDQVAEINKKYQQHFYPFLEMQNDIQDCLLRFNEKTEDLAFYYVMWLDIFQVSPYLIVQAEEIIEGNDFMVSCQTIPDYIRSYIENAGERFKLSFINLDDIGINNTAKILAATGYEIYSDIKNGLLGYAIGGKIGAIGGPLGMVIGVGLNMIANAVIDAFASSKIKMEKYNECKDLLRNSFEENRVYLISIL